ncbi:MAG: hypothetical protein AAGN82_13095 [Myxococcota bacterium]
MNPKLAKLVWLPGLVVLGCGGADRPKPAPAPATTASAPPPSPAPTASEEPKQPAAHLSLAWSDAGLVVATCGDEEMARHTLVMPDGAQFPITTDYPQAGFRPYRRGTPRWQPGADVVALPDDRGVVLWDAKRRQTVRRLPLDGGTDAPSVTWSPHGGSLATNTPLTVREMGHVPQALMTWNVTAGTSRTVARTQGHMLSWNPNGKAIASGQGIILSFSAPPVTGDEVVVSHLSGGRQTLPGHTPVFDPTGRHLAVGAGLNGLEDGKGAITTIYDANTLSQRAEVPGHRPQWSDDGKVLMTQVEEALVIASSDGKEKARVPVGGGNWPVATLSPDGSRIALRGNGALTIWEVATMKATSHPTRNDGGPVWITGDVVAAYGGYTEGTTVISLKRGATAHVTATMADGTCRVRFASTDDTKGPAAWARVFGRKPSASTAAPAATPAPTRGVTLTHGKTPAGTAEMEVAWSADDGAFVARCQEQGSRTLVDVTAERTHPLPPATNTRPPPAWNRDSTHLALHTPTGMVVVERASGKTTASVPTPGATEAEAFWGPPSNPMLAVSWIANRDRDGARVALLDPKTGKVQTTIKVPPSKRSAGVRWKPDGTRLLTFPAVHGYFDDASSTLHVWDAKSGRRLSAFSPKPSKDGIQAPRLAGWHPTDDVVYTSTGSGGMFNMWSHTADEVRLWNGAGRSLGSLEGNTWRIEGGVLATVAGNDYRSATPPSTTFYELSTRKRLATVVGTLSALDENGKWAVTTVSPYSNHNARSAEPVVHWLWRLPDGARLHRLVFGRDNEPNAVHRIADLKYAAWRTPYTIAGGTRPAGFTVWDLTTARRVLERRFDAVVEFFGQTWLADGRVLQLSYLDGRQRFIDVSDGRWVDVVAKGESCGITVIDEKGATTLAALKKLLGL